jgi:hypothetical protein
MKVVVKNSINKWANIICLAILLFIFFADKTINHTMTTKYSSKQEVQ